MNMKMNDEYGCAFTLELFDAGFRYFLDFDVFARRERTRARKRFETAFRLRAQERKFIVCFFEERRCKDAAYLDERGALLLFGKYPPSPERYAMRHTVFLGARQYYGDEYYLLRKQWQEDLLSMFHAPVNAGVGPHYPPLIDDETYARAMARRALEIGASNALKITRLTLDYYFDYYGGYPAREEINDAGWVSRSEERIAAIGAEKFFLELLAMLRKGF